MITDQILNIRPIEGFEIIPNGDFDFALPYFEQVKEYFSVPASLSLSKTANRFPPNYSEDLVQVYKRMNFNLKEWIVVAFFVDDFDLVSKVVLVSKSSHKEGVIFDLKAKEVTDLFFRGFTIQEAADLSILTDDEYLKVSGFEEEKVVTECFIDYEDEEFEEEVNHFISVNIESPVFEATTKKKILNLGSAPEALSVEEDDQGDLDIEVEKPAFTGNKKGKIRNLGYSGSFKKTEKVIEKPQPKSVEIELPSFEANKSSKVANLGFANQVKKPKIVTKVYEEGRYKTQDFEANSQKKITNYDKVIKTESRKWSYIDVYKLKPNVYERERVSINCGDFKNDKQLFEDTYQRLLKINKLEISNECVFVPNAFNESDEIFKTIKVLKMNESKVLALTIKDDAVKNALILNNGLFVLLNGENLFEIICLSKTGIDIDDRAYPYINSAYLLKMTGNSND